MPPFKTSVIIEATLSVEADCRAPTYPVRVGGSRLCEARAAAIRRICLEGAV